MRISDLVECIQLAKTLSFTQTAKHFYISRSALTKHIASLEQEFDIVIFERASNGVALTDAGSRFIEAAERLMGEYGRFVETIDNVYRSSEKTIFITFLYGAAFDLMGGVKTAFKELYPNVLLQFIAAEMTEVFSNIEAGQADFAITSSASIPEVDWDYYNWVPFYRDELVAMVPRSNPLFGRELLTLDDLRGVPFIRMSKLMFRSNDMSPVAQFARSLEAVADVRHDVYDLVGSKFLVDTGEYVALGLRHAAAFFGDDITLIPLEGSEQVNCEVGAFWKRSEDSPEIDALVEIVRQQTRLSPLRDRYAI